MSKSKRSTIAIYLIVTLLLFAIAGGYTFITLRFPMKYQSTIAKWANEYGLDPYYVSSIIWTESKFKAQSVSSAGAVGLMQILPETGQWIAEKLKISDFEADMLLETDVNIRMGSWYLSFLEERFSNQDTRSAAYNAGQTKVAEWLKDSSYSEDGKTLKAIPYQETENYVKRVNQAYVVYKMLYKFS